MSWTDALAIVLAGLGAGTINTIVGSGSLITFPVLVLLGIAPVTANMSNSLGLTGAALTSIPGMRHLLAEVGQLVRRLLPPAVVGSVVGALLLLVLPAEAFDVIVPVLIALALVLVVAGPRITARLRGAGPHRDRMGAAVVSAFLTAIYGGYFGAAQGIILIALLGLFVHHDVTRLNAVKVVLSSVTNLVASLVFIAVSPQRVRWDVAGLIALGALGGGWLGARIGRRIAPGALRLVIVVVGLVAIAHLVL